jgi:hypothetical protein
MAGGLQPEATVQSGALRANARACICEQYVHNVHNDVPGSGIPGGYGAYAQGLDNYLLHNGYVRQIAKPQKGDIIVFYGGLKSSLLNSKGRTIGTVTTDAPSVRPGGDSRNWSRRSG